MGPSRRFALLPLIACAAFGQTPTITTVRNQAVGAGSPADKLCPGVRANITGTNFGTSASIAVTVGGKQAAVIPPVTATNLVVEIPVDAALGATTITVGGSAPFPITLVAAAPALFVDSTGAPQAFHNDGTNVDASHPAFPGETIGFAGTGFGPTNPVVPTGTVLTNNQNINIVDNVTATVAGKPAQVQYATLGTGGIAQVGIDILGIQIPSGLAAGTRAVQFTVTPQGGTAVQSNAVAIPITAPPALTLVNNYSNVLPGLPNYGIAQGAIFDIYGAGLANSSTPLQNPPLQTNLGGVTINVTVNGTTVNPFIYFISPTQIAAILPSNTPVGDGQISVVNNGTTIGPSPIHVVPSAFGLLTLSGLGVGMAAMYDASFNLVGLTNALNPGDTVNLFGSGVGPSPDSDQNVISAPTNLVNTLNVKVFVGGQQAQVTYAGRTIYPGLDQVQIVIPSNASPGCFVGVVVATGNSVSNYGTLPLAASGRTCSEPTLGIPAAAFQAISAKSFFSVGVLDLSKDSYGPFTDKLSGIFLRVTPATFAAADLSNPSIGSCSVYTWSGQDNGSPGNLGIGSILPMNAGSALNVTGPNGKMSVPYQNFQYKAIIGGTPNSGPVLPVFIPNGGGSFTIDNGSGGPDVGAFTATVKGGQPPVWGAQNTISTVTRTSPAAITWTGGLPEYTATVSGWSSTLGPIGTVGATYTCAVQSTDGQFTPPAGVMASLPAGPGGVSVFFYETPQPFIATGLDFGFLRLSYEFDSNQVTYR